MAGRRPQDRHHAADAHQRRAGSGRAGKRDGASSRRWHTDRSRTECAVDAPPERCPGLPQTRRRRPPHLNHRRLDADGDAAARHAHERAPGDHAGHETTAPTSTSLPTSTATSAPTATRTRTPSPTAGPSPTPLRPTPQSGRKIGTVAQIDGYTWTIKEVDTLLRVLVDASTEWVNNPKLGDRVEVTFVIKDGVILATRIEKIGWTRCHA